MDPTAPVRDPNLRWKSVVAGLIAGGVVGATAGYAVGIRVAEERIATAKERAEELVEKNNELSKALQQEQKKVLELEKKLPQGPDCDALNAVIKRKESEIAKQRERVSMTSPLKALTISESGEHEVEQVDFMHELAKKDLEALSQQKRDLEQRLDSCL